MDTDQAYAELGLPADASDSQLKARWRKLVAAWHPDRNPAADALARMQRINTAYQCIRQSRDEPDEPDGSQETATPGAEHAPGAAEAPAPQGEEGMADAAEKGGEDSEGEKETRGHAAPEVPRRVHLRKLRLSLEDVIQGCTRTVRGQFSLKCPSCEGQGRRIQAHVCPTCHGRGSLRKPSLFGWMWTQENCPDCDGDGRQHETCEDCEGTGSRSITYRHKVRFPAGIRSGHVLTVPAARYGHLDVDLELQVEIEPHPLFELGDDGLLRCEMPVNGMAWLLGRWVDVPTPDGLQQMRLNREATTYRLRGQGFPLEPHGERGDYLITVQPQFAPAGNAQVEALVEQLVAATDQALLPEPDSDQPAWRERLRQWQTGRKNAD